MNGLHKLLLTLVVGLLTVFGCRAQTKYEAESAALTGVTIATSHAGYTGSGYIDGFDNNNTDKVTFTVNVATAGAYPLVIRYSGPSGEKFQTLQVNGTTVSACAVQFPANANWVDKVYGNINLNAGNNTIAIVSCFGWFQLDYITVGSGGTNSLTVSPASLSFSSSAGSSNVTVTSNVSWTSTDNQTWITVAPASGSANGSVSVSVTANTGSTQRTGTVTIAGGGITRTVSVTQAGVTPTQTKYEAESAALSGTTTSSAGTGFSGSGYVTGMDAANDKITFTVSASSAGSYPLVIRFLNSCGACEKYQNVRINSGATVNTQFLGTSSTWGDKNYGNVNLNAGNNTIEISYSWGWTEFDYITVGTGGTGNNLTASPSTLSFGSASGSSSVSVTSNVSWSVTDNQTWLSVSPASGSNNGTVSVSVTTNSASTTRSGTVTITGGGITQNISVSQAGTVAPGPVTIGTNFWRVDWGNGWSDYYATGVNWSTTTNPWRSDLITDLNPYSVLRFMDWGPVNGSNFVNWSDRIPKTADHYNGAIVPLTNGDGSATSGRGVAYEWQIDLCNRATADMWVNVPHKASDDYVRQLARLIRDNLSNPNGTRKVYVEYSNEVWNWGFDQTNYADQQGRALGLGHSYPFKGKDVWIDPWWAFYVLRSCQVARIFEQEFAGQTNRLVKVLGTQLGYDNWPDLVANWGDIHPPTLQKMAGLVQPALNPNNVVFDMYTVAPYWNGNDLASMQANIAYLEDKIGEVRRALTDHGNGIKLACYEGGQDGGNQVANAQNAGIYNVYMDALNRITPLIQGPFVHYTHVAWDGGHAWGAKQSTSSSLSTSHKYRALVDWVNGHGGPASVMDDVVVLNEEPAENFVSTYPNPVRSDAVIVTVYTNEAVQGRVTLTDSQVKEVAEIKTTFVVGGNTLSIPVNSLKNGLYILRVQKGNQVVTKKVLIER